MNILPLSSIVICVLLPLTVLSATTVSFEDLLHEMVDLKSLSEYPSPAYIAARASSYEPVCPVDSVPPRLGNYDHGFYLDTLPEGYLMLDEPGPGVITHIWSARSNGTLVFYFDNDTAPSWSIAMSTLLNGTGIIKPPFSHVVAKGENCYFPIPYRSRCRVFYQGSSPDIYYHIDYRTYQQDIELPTFDTSMLSEYRELADSIGSALSGSDESPDHELAEPAFSGSIDPYQVVTAAEFEGPGAITELAITPEEGLSSAFLRTCLLEITFDGTDYPQVRVPLGDFFCAVPRNKHYRTLPVEISEDGMLLCRWNMPFREKATVRLVNLGDQEGACSMIIRTEPAEFTENTMYFYARWRQDPNTAICRFLYWNIFMAELWEEHPILHIIGKGVHVGTFLQIWNEQSEWWGEGDETITIDDQPEPNFRGTGTEDYFGYAWSTTTTFSHAYHAQPYSDGFSGYTANARFHISDPQPFTTSYKFDLEIQTAFKPTTMDFGRTVFFYACGKATTDHDTITDDDLYLRLNTPVGKPIVLAPPLSSGISVRYNASLKQVVVTGTTGSKATATMRIFNAEGRVVATGKLTGTLSTAALAPGLYIANVVAGSFRSNVRFIIDR